MKREWRGVRKDEVRAQWAGVYVTMNAKGTIVMNRVTHERMGEPGGFVVLCDAATTRSG